MKKLLAWVKSFFAKKEQLITARDICGFISVARLTPQEVMHIERYLNWKLNFGRRSGRTTRLANIYIQELFINKSILIVDHHALESAPRTVSGSLSARASEHLSKKIIARLYHEHGLMNGRELRVTETRYGEFKIEFKP